MFINELGNYNLKSKLNTYPRFKRELELARSENTGKLGFYRAIRGTLHVCRYMGMLPIKGLEHDDSRKSRYTWKSPYIITFIIIVVVQLFQKLLQLNKGVFTQDVLDVPTLSSSLTSLTIFCSLLHLIIFSKNWDKMIAKIEAIEQSFSSFPQKSIRCMNIILWVLLIDGLVLFMLYQGHKYQTVLLCRQHPGDSGLFIKSFTLSDLQPVFRIIPFSYFSAFIFQVAKVQNSFIWMFCDILVINICYYLIVRFKQFNTILNQKEIEISNKERNGNEAQWPELQQHYTRLMKLVYILDQNINPMVFFSCFNIVFIGKQIYLALNPKLPDEKTCTNGNLELLKLIYYLFAAATLVARVFLVCSVASRVHTLSRKPLDKLYTCPAHAYDKRFERFIDQVFHSNVSLSGFRCFSITQSTILSMLGTLLTYELLLLQNL